MPYIMAVESVQRADGEWVRRAWHPELPGCVVEAPTAIEAIERLDEERVRYISSRLDRGEPVPVTRAPLRVPSAPLDPHRLGFARWLVEQGRVRDH